MISKSKCEVSHILMIYKIIHFYDDFFVHGLGLGCCHLLFEEKVKSLKRDEILVKQILLAYAIFLFINFQLYDKLINFSIVAGDKKLLVFILKHLLILLFHFNVNISFFQFVQSMRLRGGRIIRYNKEHKIEEVKSQESNFESISFERIKVELVA